MQTKSGLLLIAAIATAACSDSPTGSDGAGARKHKPLGPIDPVRAQAASVDCPERCGYALDVTPGGGEPRVFAVTEDAVVQGRYTDAGRWFNWTRDGGTGVTTLSAPAPAYEPTAWSGNSWGQTVGWIFAPTADPQNPAMYAAAWEPDGGLVFLRGGPNDSRINGNATAVSVNSVIVGYGKFEGDTGAWRPFRYHYQDGVQFLTPEGTQGSVEDVNGAGTIVGSYSAVVRNATPTWFIWTPQGGRQDMGPGRAYAISESGYIVGTNGSGSFLRTPQGQTISLPSGWQPVDVNHWGEVLLQANSLNVAGPGECGAAVWYQGYGLLKLSSPVAGSPECYVGSINSWGDVAGTVTATGGPFAGPHTPVVWTWQGNESRFVR